MQIFIVTASGKGAPRLFVPQSKCYGGNKFRDCSFIALIESMDLQAGTALCLGTVLLPTLLDFDWVLVIC